MNEEGQDHLPRILLPQILDTQVHVLGHLHSNFQTQNQLIGKKTAQRDYTSIHGIAHTAQSTVATTNVQNAHLSTMERKTKSYFSAFAFCSRGASSMTHFIHPLPTPIKVPRIVGGPIHIVGGLGTVALAFPFMHLLGEGVIVAQWIAVRSLAEVTLQRAIVFLLGNGGGFHRSNCVVLMNVGLEWCVHRQL